MLRAIVHISSRQWTVRNVDDSLAPDSNVILSSIVSLQRTVDRERSREQLILVRGMASPDVYVRSVWYCTVLYGIAYVMQIPHRTAKGNH